MALTPAEKNELLDLALEKNTAITVDWKASVEEVVASVKDILPELNLSSEPERQEAGNWIEPILLNEEEVSFNMESPSLILDLISTINHELEKNNQTFVFLDSQDDSYSFLLINTSELEDYLEKGFSQV